MLVGITNQERFKSVHFTLYMFVVVHKCNLRLGKQKSKLLLGVPTVGFPLYPKASVRLQVAERKQLSTVTTALFTPR